MADQFLMTWLPPDAPLGGLVPDSLEREPVAHGQPAYAQVPSANQYDLGWPAPVAPPVQPRPRGAPWWLVVVVAVGALVAGALLGGIVVGVVGMVMSDAADETPPMLTAGPGGDLATVSGEVGSCFRGRVDAFFGEPEVLSVDAAVSCEGRHDLEVYATTTAPLSTTAAYPADDLSYFADGACYVTFDEYVGLAYADSVYEYMPLVPSEQAWRQGDRAVRCVLYDINGDELDGPARSSAR